MPATFYQHPSAKAIMDDPREPPHPRVSVNLDVDPFLTLTPEPLDGAADASVFRAKCAQRAERRQAMEVYAERGEEELFQGALADSKDAARIAAILGERERITAKDGLQAGAVAVRLHDPAWQSVRRYRHASQNLISLRNLLSKHGLSACIPDKELRECADGMAGAGWQAAIRVLDNSQPVGLHEWCAARLGFHSICEEM